jgi:hypothetical protein
LIHVLDKQEISTSTTTTTAPASAVAHMNDTRAGATDNGGVQHQADRLGPGILELLVWVVAGAGTVAELGLQVGVDLAGLDEVDQAWRSMSRISTGIVPTAPTV